MKEKKYIIDNPNLMAEWNTEKNLSLNLNPKKLALGSGKKVWWKCQKGHEWQARVDHRNNGSGCLYCSNKKILPGYNDLSTINPELAKEWNYEKNGCLTPEMFAVNSGKNVWWKCQKGHEWQAVIARRNYGTACPICNSERHTSFPEYALVYYLKKYGLDVIHSYKEEGYELDIYIPSKKIAIEYDGDYWHKNKKQKDLEKNLKCKNKDIKLYRIRDGLLPLNDSSIDYVVQKNQKDLSKVITQVLFEITEMSVDVDIKRDSIAIENLRIYTEKENSLLFSNPQLSKEWNYEKNGNLTPEMFSVNSGKKVWWKCQKGHEWQTSVANRNTGNGCPYCSGQKVFQGYNDLATINPGLTKEWHYAKNSNLKPENFTANSGRKVWWKCNKGHEYQSAIIQKNKGAGCPFCLNQRLLPGYNDLATRNPSLAKEWDDEKNGNLKPSNVFSNGSQKVWWLCKKGHNYQATISNRANGRGCPYCSSHRVVVGENDLATMNPELTKEWNKTLNEKLTPFDVLSNSNKKVWWKCQKGHEWQASVDHRNNGSGCPYCSNRKVLQGYNDLATNNPKLAKEWDYAKNGDLKPEDFTANSRRKVWWACQKGHNWESRIDHRNNGSGCPYCSKRRKLDTSLNKS